MLQKVITSMWCPFLGFTMIGNVTFFVNHVVIRSRIQLKKKMFLVRQNRLQLKLFFILNECQLLHAVTGYTYIYIKIGHKQIIQKHMNEMVWILMNLWKHKIVMICHESVGRPQVLRDRTGQNYSLRANIWCFINLLLILC